MNLVAECSYCTKKNHVVASTVVFLFLLLSSFVLDAFYLLSCGWTSGLFLVVAIMSNSVKDIFIHIFLWVCAILIFLGVEQLGFV